MKSRFSNINSTYKLAIVFITLIVTVVSVSLMMSSIHSEGKDSPESNAVRISGSVEEAAYEPDASDYFIGTDIFEIKVNDYSGKRLVLLSRQAVDRVLQSFTDTFINRNKLEKEELVSVKLADNYSVLPVYDNTAPITEQEALQILLTGSDEKEIYKLQNGDTLSSIAKKLDLRMEDIIKANPRVEGRENRLQVGEELSLSVPKPLLVLEVCKTATYDEKILFDVHITNNDSEYKTYVSVKVKGEEGIANITANIVEENGIINPDRTTELSRTIIKQAVAQEEVRGTSQVPPKRAVGSFISPVGSYTLSSGYGSRNGSFHYGIDIPKATGTTVSASDGGVVSNVNYNSYAATGLMVTVNHENGYQTRYMHLSQISVAPGERIHQGQKIGAVGNTGRSTGPHLHFEIIKNGSNINPLTILR